MLIFFDGLGNGEKAPIILPNGPKVTISVTTASGNRALKKDLQSWTSAHSFNDLLVDSERNSSQTPRHNHPYPCLFSILILWKATWVNDDTDVFCSFTAQAAIAQFTSKHLLLNLPAISTKRFHKTHNIEGLYPPYELRHLGYVFSRSICNLFIKSIFSCNRVMMPMPSGSCRKNTK
jgi:hypothetical protein